MICEKEYGEQYKEHFLEQYKLYVEMADRVSSRRVQSNRFYISILTGLLALLSIAIGMDKVKDYCHVVFGIVAILGLALCCIWCKTIQTYRRLNSGKFDVIHEMEQKLPFSCYEEEWGILERNHYLKLTVIEGIVPILVSLPYLLLLIYAILMVQ